MIGQAVRDAALNHIANNGDELVLCSQEPTTFAEANATYALARVTGGLAAADYSVQAGDAGGQSRKVTLNAQTTTGEADGTATHYALVDTVNQVLLATTSMTNVAITNGVDQDVQAVDVLELGAATTS